MCNNVIFKLDNPIKHSISKVYLFILQVVNEHHRNNNLEDLRIDSRSVVIKIKRSRFLDILNNQYSEYKRLDNILNSLYNTSVISEEYCDNNLAKSTKIKLVLSQMYDVNSDAFEIFIPRVIFDVVTSENKDIETANSLANMISFTGIYTGRLYELLFIRNSNQSLVKSIPELKEWFGIHNKKSYDTYANLKNKVVNPSINELNMLGYVNITVNEIKSFRKVDSLEFIIDTNND